MIDQRYIKSITIFGQSPEWLFNKLTITQSCARWPTGAWLGNFPAVLHDSPVMLHDWPTVPIPQMRSTYVHLLKMNIALVRFFYIGFRIYLRFHASTLCFGTPVEEFFARKRGWLFKMEDEQSNMTVFAILYSVFFPTHLTKNAYLTY